ncbi:MAG: 16S rRNA (cytosine(1402)-N(4))-methyltransferase RsmH [Actinobacteria bacterium]|nr:16S rRNA (cytosine(1402)-N(4))-methyltransferase RsmH [Actinomycetota bacterium]
MQYKHLPVLRKEVVHYLNLKNGDIVFDGTLGGAGHTIEIIKAIAPTGKIIGVDLDSQATGTAARNIEYAGFGGLAHIIKGNYSNIKKILNALKIRQINGFLLDLGLSSIQLGESGKGFSYMRKEKLDMRFDEESDISAFDIVNNYQEDRLKEIFYKFGEEPWAARIAAEIIKRRKVKPVEFTDELVEIIKNSIPLKYRRRGHPAKRVFQAIRIETNCELENLKTALCDGLELLVPGARMAIISFHSLEDRIVKEYFETFAGRCKCPPGMPVCICGAKKRGNIVTKKPVKPSEAELKKNPRAKSAKLRVFEKI